MTFSSVNSLSDKRVYAQNIAPTDTRTGNLWVDTSQTPPRTMVYSADSEAWVKASGEFPTAITHESFNFGESNVNLSHNGTTLNNGNIRIQGDRQTLMGTDAGSTTGESPYFETHSVDIEPNRPIDRFHLRVTEGSAANEIQAMRVKDSEGNILAEDTTGWDGSGAITGFMLNPGETYTFEADSGQYSDLRNVGGLDGDVGPVIYSNANDPIFFETLTVYGPRISGNATVGWTDAPKAIQSWDIVNYQKSDNGGNVTPIVQENDGNGWTDVIRGANRYHDISEIDPNNDVRIKFELERATGDQTPEADYASRRYIR